MKTKNTNKRTKIKLNKEDARDIVSGVVGGWGNEDKFELISNDIIDTSRWSVIYRAVIKELETGRFFEATYSEGATEYQDEQPFEHDDAIFTEVFPVEKTVVIYE